MIGLGDGIKNAQGEMSQMSSPKSGGGIIQSWINQHAPGATVTTPNRGVVHIGGSKFKTQMFDDMGAIHTPSIIEELHGGDLPLGEVKKIKAIKRFSLGGFLDDAAPYIGAGVGGFYGGPTGAMAGYTLGSAYSHKDDAKDAQHKADAYNAQQLENAQAQQEKYDARYEEMLGKLEDSLKKDAELYGLSMDDLQGYLSGKAEVAEKYKARVDNNLQKLNGDITRFDTVADKALHSYLDTTTKTAQALDLTNETMRTAVARNNAEYAEHKAMFGTVKDNMTDYMNNLDPKSFSANAKAHLNREYLNTMQSLNRTMAKRHIIDSGMYDEQTINNSFKLATARAGADVNAEQKVRDLQSKWLQFGEASKVNAGAGLAYAGQGTQMNAQIKNADANTANQSNMYSAGVSQFKVNNAQTNANRNDPFNANLQFINAIHANPATSIYGNMLGATGSYEFQSGNNLGNAYGLAASQNAQNAGNMNSLLGNTIATGMKAAANTDWGGNIFGDDDTPKVEDYANQIDTTRL